MSEEPDPLGPGSEGPDEASPESYAPPPPPERVPFWGYSDLAMFLVLALPSMLAGLGVVKGIVWALRLKFPNRAAELLTSQFAGYAILFVVLWLILQMKYERPFWHSLGWTDPGISLAGMILPGIAMAFLVVLIAYAIKTPTSSNPMMELMKDRMSIVLMAIFGTTVGPLCEELIFRGFLQPLLVRSFGVVAGIIAAALPFGLLHYQEYGNSWRHVLVIALAGASFGVMRQVTGSTKASTIMHGAYNALFFAALLARPTDLPL